MLIVGVKDRHIMKESSHFGGQKYNKVGHSFTFTSIKHLNKYVPNVARLMEKDQWASMIRIVKLN